MSANVLFIDAETFRDAVGISAAIDDRMLKPQMKIAQDMYLQPALGSTLYLALQSEITADIIAADDVTLLRGYIKDCLVWYIMSLLPFALSYQMYAKGVLQKNSEESQNPTRADLELIANRYKKTAEFYKERLILYLRQNYTLYQGYSFPGSGWDIIYPEARAYTCPIYLGPRRRPHGGSVLNQVAPPTPQPTYMEVTLYQRPTIGLNTFTIDTMPVSATVLLATRSGLVKDIKIVAVTDPGQLQIVGNIVTLPVGDNVQAATEDESGMSELFTFTIKYNV